MNTKTQSTQSNNAATLINTPHGIRYAHFCALKGAVRLETLGLKRRGESARSIACRELGLPPRTPAAKVLAKLEDKVAEMLAERELPDQEDVTDHGVHGVRCSDCGEVLPEPSRQASCPCKAEG